MNDQSSSSVQAAKSPARRIVLIYTLLAAAWILFSDELAAMVGSQETFTTISILKGWLFVVLTASLLYFLIQRYFVQLEETRRTLAVGQERFRQLFEVTPVPLCFVDRDGVLVNRNDRFVETFGYTQEDASTLAEWWQRAYPDEDYRRWVIETWGGAVQSAVREKNDIKPIEYRVTCKDGTVRLTEISGITLGDELLAILTDVTERRRSEEALRESEERYRSLFSSMQEGFCLLEPVRDGAGKPIDFRYVEVNPAYERMGGMSRTRLIGRTMREASPTVEEYWLALFAGVDETRSPATLEDYSHRFGRFLHVYAYRLASGQIAAIIADATEQRNIRAEREKTQRLESLGVLAGGIAHDFNNIFTAAVGYLSLARVQVGEGHKADVRLAACENALARATVLTRQLLTFARGGEPIKKAISVGELLREAAGFASHGSPVRCQFVLVEDLWLVEADEGQLSQVIHNLVINAVQAMPGGGTVTLGAENVGSAKEGKRLVKISVADTGVGIPEENLPNVFDPYFTTKQQGSGLGLATCYSIVKRHGGSITVTSTPGEGSTFHVYLPASPEGSAVEPREKIEVIGGSGRVLVMDDEEAVREAARALLEELGYSVECTEDGNAAIDLYRQRKGEGSPFDAVIMDLTIPGGVGGREAVASLLQADPGAKVIVSSGYSTDPVMANYRNYGFCAVLGKPYRLQEMSKVLQEALNGTDSDCPLTTSRMPRKPRAENGTRREASAVA